MQRFSNAVCYLTFSSIRRSHPPYPHVSNAYIITAGFFRILLIVRLVCTSQSYRYISYITFAPQPSQHQGHPMSTFCQRLHIRQSLRWQIPGTLSLLASCPSAFLAQLPRDCRAWYFNRMLSGNAAFASLGTLDKLLRTNTEPSDFPRSDHSVSQRLQRTSASRSVRLETSPLRFLAKYGTLKNLARNASARAPTNQQVTSLTGTASKRRESATSCHSSTVASDLGSRHLGTLDKKALYLSFKPENYPSVDNVNAPMRLSNDTPMSFGEYVAELDYDVNDIHIASLVDPSGGRLGRLALLSAVWSHDLVMFFFPDRKLRPKDVLLVNGSERWWIDETVLSRGLFTAVAKREVHYQNIGIST